MSIVSPIVLKYCWTADELSRAQAYHFRHQIRPVFRFIGHSIFALMLVAGAVGTWYGVSWTSIGFLTAGIYWFRLRKIGRKYFLRRQFAKRPDRDLEIEWRLAADAIHIESKLGQTDCRWDAFSKIAVGKDGMLLYSSDQIFHWLPRSAFVSDAEFFRLIDTAKTKIPRHFEIA